MPVRMPDMYAKGHPDYADNKFRDRESHPKPRHFPKIGQQECHGYNEGKSAQNGDDSGRLCLIRGSVVYGQDNIESGKQAACEIQADAANRNFLQLLVAFAVKNPGNTICMEKYS